MKTLPSFDELKIMAKENPEQLEELRLSMSEEIIANAHKTSQPNLRKQLTHINQVIESSNNPDQTNMLLLRELMLKFNRFNNAINQSSTFNAQEATVIDNSDKTRNKN